MINAGYFSLRKYKTANRGIEYKIYLRNGDDYLVMLILSSYE